VTPEPKDLLRGASRTLTDVVLPALGDPFAIEQVKTVLRVLAHLEAVVDEAYPLEAAEAADLGRFLGEVARSTDPALASLGSDDPLPSASPLPPYRELRDANVQRKRGVTEVIRALARGASDPKIQAALDDLTRRQLGRERRWTNPGRPSK
jgi:hypothetical protein